MYDFREFRELVKSVVSKVNESANWKWSARVNKNEIKLTNGYIKGEYEKDYFSLKLDQHYGDVTIEGMDCLDMVFSYNIVGTDFYDDGNIEECIEHGIKAAENYFSNRY